jgi:hypothetical protein
MGLRARARRERPLLDDWVTGVIQRVLAST